MTIWSAFQLPDGLSSSASIPIDMSTTSWRQGMGPSSSWPLGGDSLDVTSAHWHIDVDGADLARAQSVFHSGLLEGSFSFVFQRKRVPFGAPLSAEAVTFSEIMCLPAGCTFAVALGAVVLKPLPCPVEIRLYLQGRTQRMMEIR